MKPPVVIKMRIIILCCFIVLTCAHDYHTRKKRSFLQLNLEETEHDFWNGKAQNILQQRLLVQPNRNIAKNVIIFLGDGLSIPTITAARIYQGQVKGLGGEESSLYFENFPYTGLSRTYCVDSQVADSACSATAYLGGVKANEGTIGVTASVGRQDCHAMVNTSHHVDSIIKWAQDEGKGTGVVTTTRITHASPAGVYAHTAERNWEHDEEVKSDGMDSENCPDIAQQLILNEVGSKLNVIMGGGRSYFLPNNKKSEKGKKGKRTDDKNLIEDWMNQKNDLNETYAYVSSKMELMNISLNTNYILGLFSPCHMSYHLDSKGDEPTLEEMTKSAIKHLSNFSNGYVLFIEGGRIDHAHHENLAKKSLDETVEFSKAVEAADNLTNPEDTLIVVTADHAHVMSLSGYAKRGVNILGFAGEDVDGLPYSTLNYANGPGFHRGSKRVDLRKLNRESKSYKFPAMVPLASETHGGDDVAVFARGPWAHLFTGSYEQNYLPHAMG